MTVTITRTPTAGGYTTINPFMVLATDFTYPAQTIQHDILGSGVPEFTVLNLGTREGTYQFLCLNYTAAIELRNFHAAAGVYTLTDTTNPAVNVSYVLAEGGNLTIEIDRETRTRYVVSIDIKAVS